MDDFGNLLSAQFPGAGFAGICAWLLCAEGTLSVAFHYGYLCHIGVI